MSLKKNFTLFVFSFLFCAFTFTGCYSIFSGGASGRVVDAESTSASKTGIADVDIYAYTSSSDWNKDFNSWNGVDRFTPQADYYSHTVSGSDGRFTLSKIIWKTDKSQFGKDADYSKIYLLFYHENYGLVKGTTLIVSDSTSDTVYQEMTKSRKTTILNINLKDVTGSSVASVPVQVSVSVPQTTTENDSPAPVIYKSTITDSGSISISYPRWQSDEDKKAGLETEPDISITYYQNSDEITWKACYNGDSADSDYSFRTEPVSKKISGSSYSITLYGKKTRLNVPVISGKCGDEDGVQIFMTATPEGKETFNCGSVSTAPATFGNNTVVHGQFSDLGQGYFWDDDSYKTQALEITLKISGGEKSAEITLPSSQTENYVELK